MRFYLTYVNHFHSAPTKKSSNKVGTSAKPSAKPSTADTAAGRPKAKVCKGFHISCLLRSPPHAHTPNPVNFPSINRN